MLAASMMLERLYCYSRPPTRPSGQRVPQRRTQFGSPASGHHRHDQFSHPFRHAAACRAAKRGQNEQAAERDALSGRSAADASRSGDYNGATGTSRPGPIGNVAEASVSGEFSDAVVSVSSADDLISEDGVKVDKLAKGWDALPARYQTVVSASVAFAICSLDKVNISVAIIPMAQDFGWSPTVSGLVQSSFFWGYMLSQIPGGYLNSKVGGRKILPIGVALWSVATAGVPIFASALPGLYASRALVGLGEGVAPSAATDMVARSIVKEERARAISFIFGGLHVGTLLGLLVAPPLIENFGWAAVFYAFGAVGLGWVLWFELVQNGIAEREPKVAEQLTAAAEGATPGSKPDATPWRGFLRNTPVRALAYTHFCNNWFHYTMLSWLPSFFSDTLSLNLSQAAQVSLAPPAAALVFSGIAGPTADALLSRGTDVATVRKLSQCVAFLGPALCLLAASFSDADWTQVGLITASLGLASFSLAGLYCNHADLSPRHAPLLLGMTNTCGAIPGIIGVVTTGAILDQTGSWALALFVPSIVFFISGAAVFAKFGSAEEQDFSNNEPFAFEANPAFSFLKRLAFWTKESTD